MKNIFTTQFALTMMLVAVLFVSEKVCSQTVVTLSPSDTTVNIGGTYRVDVTVMFNSTNVTNTGEYTFEWYINGTLDPTQNLSYLEFPITDVTDSGTFYCNAFQTIDMITTQSNTARLNVTDNGCTTGFASLTVTSSGMCTTDTIMLLASGGASYKWNDNSTNSTLKIKPLPLGTFTYTVTVTDGAGCTEAKTKSLTITSCGGTNPSVYIPPVQPICKGNSVTLTAITMEGAAPYTYSWTPVTVLNNPTLDQLDATPQVNTTYTVQVKDANNNTASASIAVTVTGPPKVNAGPDLWICDNTSKTIILPDDSMGTQYTWSDTSTGLSHIVPPISAIYIVTASLNGCTASDMVAVKASSSYLEAFIMVDTTYGNTLTVFNQMFDAKLQKVLWDFDDGNYASQQITATHTYTKPGFYNVCQTISDIESGCQARNCKNIEVGTGGCKAEFLESIDNASKKVTFTDASSANMTEFFWNFGDGYSDITKQPIHTYKYTGYYLVEFYAFNKAGGCMDKYTKVLKVGDASKDCEADFYYDIDLATHQLNFFSNSYGMNLNNYNWDFGDNSTPANSQNTLHQYNDGGYYNVCLIAKSDNCENITCKTIKAGNEQTFCQADFAYVVDPLTNTVALTDQSKGKVDSWEWNVNNTKYTTQNPTHVFSAIGLYQVTLKIKNSQCVSFTNQLINVGDNSGNIKCVFGYLADSTLKTKGVLPVEFKGASYGDAATVEWDFGDGTSNSSSMSPTHNYDAPGDYEICMKIADPNTGQKDGSCKTITVTGIHEAENNSHLISIYPNPAKQSLVVSTKSLVNTGNTTIKITNAVGQFVFSEELKMNNEQLKIDISNLQSGIYFIKVQSDNASVAEKFIKE